MSRMKGKERSFGPISCRKGTDPNDISIPPPKGNSRPKGDLLSSASLRGMVGRY